LGFPPPPHTLYVTQLQAGFFVPDPLFFVVENNSEFPSSKSFAFALILQVEHAKQNIPKSLHLFSCGGLDAVLQAIVLLGCQIVIEFRLLITSLRFVTPFSFSSSPPTSGSTSAPLVRFFVDLLVESGGFFTHLLLSFNITQDFLRQEIAPPNSEDRGPFFTDRSALIRFPLSSNPRS